jgi:hypothetical protein
MTPRNVFLRLALRVAVLIAAGCSSDPLSSEGVTQIPAGNALGTAMTGEYIVERHVTACRGTCTAPTGSDLMLCSVGQALQDPATLEQHDGSLRLTFDRDPSSDGSFVGWGIDSELPPTMNGGMDADGSIDVGGFLDPIRSNQQKSAAVDARLIGQATGRSSSRS